jgi:hypothetical protein
MFKVRGKGKLISGLSEKKVVDKKTGEEVTEIVETPIKKKEEDLGEKENNKEEDS